MNKVKEKIKIRQATKLGYIEMIPGGVADLSFPTSKTRRGRVEEEGALAPTITTTGGLYKMDYDKEEFIKKLKIRKLVPEETFILMGMTAEDCVKCRELGVSNSQLYKQAGNGLISNCVQYIMEHLYKTTEDNTYITTDERMVSDGYGI